MTRTATRNPADLVTNDTNEKRQEFMSRQESRKLLMMGAALLVLVVFMFSSAFPGKPSESGPEVRIGRSVKKTIQGDGMLRAAEAPPHMGPFQDAKKALAAKVAHQEAKDREARGELKKVTRETFSFDEALLRGVKDGELDKVEEPAFYGLAAKVHFMSDEELKAAPKTVGTFKWDDLRTPEGRDEARGKFITIQGRFLIPLWQRVLERQPNEAGTELPWVWQGVFRVQNRGFVLSITDKNMEPGIGISSEAIQVTGAFLKIYRYKTAEGEKSFPHLIVKSMRRAPKPAKWDYMNSPIMWFVMALIVVASIGTFFYARGSRAGAERVDEWRRQKVLDRAKAAAKAGDFDKARGARKPAPADGAPPESVGDPGAEVPPGEAAAKEPASPAAESPATEPVAETAEPVAETTEPVAEETTEPVAETTEPVAETTEPVAETTEPVAETTDTEPAADEAPKPDA